MANHSDSLRLDKKRAQGGNIPKPTSVVMSILGVVLIGYAITKAGPYQGWPDALQISAWFALPFAMVFWRIATSKKPMPKLRCPKHLASVLPKPYFLKQLRREMLRADRSKIPLSIVILSFDEDLGGEIVPFQTQAFLERLQAGIRETDILGHAGNGSIGLVLIDTNSGGREAYLKKLLAGHEKLPVSVVSASYPDQVFANFMAGSEDASEAEVLFPDHSTDRIGFGYSLKRSIDLIGALSAILLFSPLLLLTAMAIKTTSPGPVIFRQLRLGKNGKPFVFYKFRSMSWNVDDRIHRDYVASLIAGNLPAVNQGHAETPLYKIKSDPRVTWFGRIIRKTSIDELPQLFNVVRGDMSLVGPRPPLPYEAEKYQSWHFWRIFEAKPGITGLWQVEGRSRTSFDDMVRLDLEYSRSCSLWLDLKILAKTVRVVLLGVGAT